MDEELHLFSKKMAIEYHESYSNTIIMIYVVFILKRMMTDPYYSLYTFSIHILSGSIFYAMKTLYTKNEFTLKYMPLVVAVYSYYCHTYWLFQTAFRAAPDNPDQVILSQDKLFKFVIAIASMSLNQVYVCVFLVTSRKMCILANIIVWGLFVKDTMQRPGNTLLFSNLICEL